MWNRFSIKVQLIVFITLVVTLVEISTIFIVLQIQKQETQNNAINDARIIAKSLNNDFVKIIINPTADMLSDLTFRLSAFKKINGVILYDDKYNPIYKYKDIKQIQNNIKNIIKDVYVLDNSKLFIQQDIIIDNQKYGAIIINIDTSFYKQKYQDMVITILTIFPFALLLGFILSLFLSRSYTKPFSKLLYAMKESDPINNQIVTINTTAQNEIKDIFDGFNNQMQQIKISTQKVNQLNQEIEDTQKEVVFTMGAIGETRSKETGNHVKRVACYSEILALHYGLDEKYAQMLKQASPMHDIGKVGIPDSILNKPGRFDEDERIIMNTHSQLGYDMLKMSTRPLLKLAAVVAYEHHEKYDGTGYPRGLKGDDIDIAGRITAIADVFDALGSDRCYKKAWDDEKIFKLFKEQRGKHFDPKLVDIFFDHLDEFLEIREKFKDIV